MSSPNVKAFDDLLTGFAARQIAGRLDLGDTDYLLNGVRVRHDQRHTFQVASAEDFNLFNTLKISSAELRHSMLLTWLLDSGATHAQGNLGFCLFLKRLNPNRENT